MIGQSTSPKFLKAGLVMLNSASDAVKRAIAVQYDPDTLTRCCQVQSVRGQGGAEQARLSTDLLEKPEQSASYVQRGVAPHIAVLETLINPTVADLFAINRQSKSGIPGKLP